MGSMAFFNNFIRFLKRKGLFVWSFGGEGIKYIGNSDDTSNQRNFLTFQSLWVTTAIPFFVVGEGNNLP